MHIYSLNDTLSRQVSTIVEDLLTISKCLQVHLLLKSTIPRSTRRINIRTTNCFIRITKTIWAINTEFDTHTCISYGRTSACVDSEVKGSKVKVTGLWNVLPAWVCMSIWLRRFLVAVSNDGWQCSGAQRENRPQPYVFAFSSINKECVDLLRRILPTARGRSRLIMPLKSTQNYKAIVDGRLHPRARTWTRAKFGSGRCSRYGCHKRVVDARK